MLRLDTHKYSCSFYKARNNISRGLYRDLLFSLDPLERIAIARAIEAEAELLGSCQGRMRHPCRTCRHVARMRITGIRAFLQNFCFDDHISIDVKAREKSEAF